MSEMIERVARGIWARRQQAYPDMAPLPAWEDETEELREDVRAEARAAIEAMREPTQEMIDSCGNGECAKWAQGAWASYIESALSQANPHEILEARQ